MKKIWLTAVIVLAMLALLTGPAFAEDGEISLSRTRLSHGDPIVISYDLTGRSFYSAELCITARHDESYYDYEPVPLTGRTGSYTFTDTYLGSSLEFRITLRDRDGGYAGGVFAEETAEFKDAWEHGNPVRIASLSYSASAAQAGETVSADYAITGGTGDYREIRLGWAVYDEDGYCVVSGLTGTGEASGTAALRPAAPGMHVLRCYVEDSDGWRYDFKKYSDGGILVTGDLTGEPLSIRLTWEDQDGNSLDWSEDRAAVGEEICLSWEISGGYSVYESWISIEASLGRPSFDSPLEADGPAGSVRFSLMTAEDLTLWFDFGDNRGDTSESVTIPAAVPAVGIEPEWMEFDYYLAPGLPLAEEYEGGFYTTNVLADVELRNREGESGTAWSMDRVSGTAEAGGMPWTDGMSIFLTKLPEGAEDCVWQIECEDEYGEEWSCEATLTVHFLEIPDGTGLPEGWEQLSMLENGRWVADIGETIRLKDVFGFTDGWCIPGRTVTASLRGAGSDEFWQNREWKGENSFSMKKAGIYPVGIVISCANIERAFSATLYVRNEDGSLPETEAEIAVDSYGAPVTDNKVNFYISDGLDIGDPVNNLNGTFSLPGILTCTAQNTELYPEGLEWKAERISGSADAELNVRNDGMNADLEMLTMPAEAGDSVFQIRCLYQDEEIWSDSFTVRVSELDGALPAGNLRTGGRTVNGGWYADTGETIPMSSIFDFTDGWRVPGGGLLVSMDSADDLFRESVNCGEGREWDMVLTEDGIYTVTVVTSSANIARAEAYTLYAGVSPDGQDDGSLQVRLITANPEVGQPLRFAVRCGGRELFARLFEQSGDGSWTPKAAMRLGTYWGWMNFEPEIFAPRNAARYRLAVSTHGVVVRPQDLMWFDEENDAAAYFDLTPKAGTPELTVEPGAQRGADLTVEFGEMPENASVIYLEVNRIGADGEEEPGFWDEIREGDIPGTYVVPGFYMTEAGSYRLTATAMAHSLAEENETGIPDSDPFIYEFELTEGALPPAPAVTVTPEEQDFPEGEDARARILFTAAGAEQVAYQYLYFNLLSGEEIGGTNPSAPVSGDTGLIGAYGPGRYMIKVWARYGGIWSEPAEGVSAVVNPAGWMETPALTWNGQPAGEKVYALKGNVPAAGAFCEGAEWILIGVDRVTGDPETPYEYVGDAAVEGESGTFDFPDPGIFAEKGTYRLRISAERRGWLPKSDRTVTLEVIDRAAAESMGTLTLPAGLKAVADGAFEGASFGAAIVPEGCGYIGHRAFAACPNLVYVRIPADAFAEEDAFADSPNAVIDRAGD